VKLGYRDVHLFQVHSVQIRIVTITMILFIYKIMLVVIIGWEYAHLMELLVSLKLVLIMEVM